MRLTAVRRVAAVLIPLLAGHAAGAAANERPDALNFAAAPAISGVTMSPSGDHAALV